MASEDPEVVGPLENATTKGSFTQEEPEAIEDLGGATHYPLRAARERTAAYIALGLTSILGFLLTLHYLMVWVFSCTDKTAEQIDALNTTMNAWLPVVSSLVGAAAAFYFAKERRAEEE